MNNFQLWPGAVFRISGGVRTQALLLRFIFKQFSPLGIFPKRLEFLAIDLNKSGLAEKEDILMVPLLGGKGPIVAPCNHQLAVQDCKFMMHFRVGPIAAVSEPERKSALT